MNIIETNLLTQFHEDRTVNVAYRVLTMKNAPPSGGHVFKATKTILELIQDIIGTNHRKINVASRVLTRKNARPPGGHVFQPTSIIFELVQDIVGMNLLTKFYEDRIIKRMIRPSFANEVVRRAYKNDLPLGSHVFQANATIFELIQDIIETNLLTKVHEDWTITVASRVLTRKNTPPPDIIWTNLLTKCHEDRKINVASTVLTRKNASPPGGHVFQPTGIILKLIQDIIGMNLLKMLNEDRALNVAPKPYFYKEKCPAPWKPCFQANVTIFELIQDIIETNLLTKFHEDWTINVASRVLTRQILMLHDT
ncbi:hypothetical protein DPMN_017806 [Dreissena polymorpha]|uniref:Uncharacterized protein n=1 Tax=Dreissena polymorpha TaxID=45954 RepID=A0A9D4S6Q8_DREPO|nr:hypothetical protein DPMN_017806 [Dreissena polymorpha]